MRLLLVSSLAVVLLAGLASAQSQSWVFRAEKDNGTARWAPGPETTMEFRCARKGAPGHDSNSVQWWLRAPGLIEMTKVAHGAVTELALAFDGEDGGIGPFVRQGGFLATRLELGAPLLDRLRSADELRLARRTTDASVQMPLSGMSPVLDELLAFCAAPAEQPRTNDANAALFDCGAPANKSELAICNTPELTALETRLTELAGERQNQLTGPPLAAFVADQTAWNGLRASCGPDVACLRNSVTGRIAFLDVKGQKRPPAPARNAATQKSGPPPLRIPATRPLTQTQLGAVLYDDRQVAQRVVVEMVRQNPQFLDDERVLQTWYKVAISGGKAPSNPAEKAQARDHLSRSAAAQAPGPFLITNQLANPFANATYEQGILAPAATRVSPPLANFGRFSKQVASLGQLDVRATSQFDISRLRVGAAQAQTMQDRMLRLLVVTEVSKLHIVGTPNTGFAIMAEGEVRYAALKRPDQRAPYSHNPPLARLDPSLLVISFAPTAPKAPAGGLAAMADQLDIPMHQNAVIDIGGDKVGTLIRLSALRAHPPKKIGAALRSYTLNVLASPAERDHVIPPVMIEPSGYTDQLRFSRLVDEFDRAELESRIDQVLWPQVQARLPKAPFEGIILHQTQLGQYDRQLGGFPINTNVQSMGLIAQGRYPALKSLPTLLQLPIDKAREMVNYLDARFGPGNRRVTLVLRYRVEDVGPADWEKSQVPATTFTPLTLSLHALDPFEPGDDPYAFRIADFDLSMHRGDPRPQASAEQIAFWDEINAIPRSNADHVTLAALGVSTDDSYLRTLVEESILVQRATAFDRPAARSAVQSQLEAAAKPKTLVLEGTANLSDYSLEEEKFRSMRLGFSFEQGQLSLPLPRIGLSNSTALSQVDMPSAMARIFVGDKRRDATATARFTAWVDVDLLAIEGNHPVLYLRVKRIILRPDFEDETGYPPTYLEVALPAPGTGAGASVPMVPVAGEAPDSLPIDSEYIDLLMVRARDGALDESTYLRMMEDRRLREKAAADIGFALPWGSFFDAPENEFNAMQRRDLLPAFTEWTRTRAAMLPETVYVQTHAAGQTGPAALQCWMMRPPVRNNFESILPPELARAMTEMNYQKHAIHLDTFNRAGRRDTHRTPEQYYVIHGRPSLVGAANQRIDNATRACAQHSRRNQQGGFEEAEQWDALISTTGAFRAPLGRDETLFYRDFGTVELSEIGPGVVRLAVDVTRTEIVGVDNSTGQVEIRQTDLMNDDSLTPRLETVDIFGISPGDPWPEARQIASERLPGALVVKADGPPPNFRLVPQNTELGPEPQFSALQNGHIFVDTGRNEILSLLREAERDPDRVLAVGSYRRFDAATVTQQQLIGALLLKYGAEPQNQSDSALHGPRPGQFLAWGARPDCLPQMQNGMRPDWTGLENQPNIREAVNLVQFFRAPSLTYFGGRSIIYKSCAPVVAAFVGEDRQAQLHLVVWSFDLALLDEVAQRPDPNAKADGDSGSQTLIENAAEIDL